MLQASIDKVAKQVNEARLHQAVSRQRAVKDWYTIRNNNNTIQFWSLIMIVVIIIASGVQAYFLRRLFNVPAVAAGSKPRA